MTWKTHLVGGVAVGAAATLLFSEVTGSQIVTTTLIPALALCGISALLSDVDEIKSKAGRVLLPVSFIFLVLQTLAKILIFFSFGKTKQRIKDNTKFLMHRGICHYPVTILSIALCGYIVIFLTAGNKMIWLLAMTAFTIGCISHILLDIISGKIALLFPISKRRFGINLVTYGGFLEVFVVRPALLLFCIVAVKMIVRF